MTPKEQALVAEMKAKLGEVLSRMDTSNNFLRGPTPVAPRRRVTPEDIKQIPERIRQRGAEITALMAFLQLIELCKRPA